MMKLYVSPGACSMSCHIAFEEAKLPFEAVISDWEAVARLNPQGAVGTLQLEDGTVITQNIAIMTYAANTPGGAHLLPKAGSVEYAQTYQWLSWTASDLHPTFTPLFSDATSDEIRKEKESELHDLFAQAEKHLTGKTYLVGERFTLADGYLFTLFGWLKDLEIATDRYKNLTSFCARIAERPAVLTVMKREKLI